MLRFLYFIGVFSVKNIQDALETFFAARINLTNLPCAEFTHAVYDEFVGNISHRVFLSLNPRLAGGGVVHQPARRSHRRLRLQHESKGTPAQEEKQNEDQQYPAKRDERRPVRAGPDAPRAEQGRQNPKHPEQ
jgi:hypothetical protein